MGRKGLVVLALLALAAGFAGAAAAQPLLVVDEVTVGGTATARLRGFDEVPAISSSGGGRFDATISADGSEVEWELSYFNMVGQVTQAHIHFAQKGVNGGIVVFLCTNLANGPAGTEHCPPSPGTISGTFTFANVGAGANAQGIGPFEMPALLRAIRAGIAYANVHSDIWPGGEIRGQLSFTPDD
jgi:CHRD domain-containing protein